MNINGRRQGNLELISTDLSNATRILMVSKRPELMYDYLESKGDRYAKLANSVVKGDSLLGAFAMNHLDEFKLENGKKIENIEDKIRFKMAERYLVTLYSRFHNEGFIIKGDINHIEAMEIHNDVFDNLDYSRDAWTLKIVFDVMPEENREKYWQSALNSIGNTEKETLLSLNTMSFMLERLEESPAKDQPRIHNWMRKAIDIDNLIDGLNITAKKIYREILPSETIDNMQYNNYILYNTGNPLIDRGTERFSFWDYPSQHLESFQVQTDWRGQTEFTHKNLLSEYYLERPDYILPETGLFDSPSVNYQPDVAHYDRMIDDLRGNIPSINNKSTPPIKYPHNMVDKSILESTYPKSEPNRQLAPRTTNLLDRFKDNEAPTNYYLERPSVVLPGTSGFKDFPTDTIRNNHHFENMIDNLRDNMSSMNNSMDSFDDKYSIPSMPSIPEFSYSGYSSGGSFSFN
ncbi:serine protease [Providencia rettgeri]|uniref:serine protease n=1 Tax=Providencia TaxID=586 RepID=UPI002275486F|nr:MULTISPECIES: serine protease [unclassified Providencia]MDB9565087.1 serine protease [Providencia rettgeri]